MFVLRKNALLKKLGVSKSTLSNWYDEMSPYFDKTFPQPFKISKGILGWDEAEVDTWLDSQKNKSRTTPLLKVVGGTEALARDIASNQQEAA